MLKTLVNEKQHTSVQLHVGHDVTASYQIPKLNDITTPILNVGLKMRDGRRLAIFFNRESGLLVVDVIAKHGKGGNEIVRRHLGAVKTPSEKECEEKNDGN